MNKILRGHSLGYGTVIIYLTSSPCHVKFLNNVVFGVACINKRLLTLKLFINVLVLVFRTVRVFPRNRLISGNVSLFVFHHSYTCFTVHVSAMKVFSSRSKIRYEIASFDFVTFHIIVCSPAQERYWNANNTVRGTCVHKTRPDHYSRFIVIKSMVKRTNFSFHFCFQRFINDSVAFALKMFH